MSNYTDTSPRYQGKYSKHFKGQKIQCDRCQFWYYRYETNGQWIKKSRKGYHICYDCWDEGLNGD